MLAYQTTREQFVPRVGAFHGHDRGGLHNYINNAHIRRQRDSPEIFEKWNYHIVSKA